jgi:hypothetical protein
MNMAPGVAGRGCAVALLTLTGQMASQGCLMTAMRFATVIGIIVIVGMRMPDMVFFLRPVARKPNDDIT